MRGTVNDSKILEKFWHDLSKKENGKCVSLKSQKGGFRLTGIA